MAIKVETNGLWSAWRQRWWRLAEKRQDFVK